MYSEKLGTWEKSRENIDLDNISSEDLFNLIQTTNVSDIVKFMTEDWKRRLNEVIQSNPKVKEALFYIIENYKKKRKNNPDKLWYMHCMEAAALVSQYWFYEADVVAAALLHDVREDIPNWEDYLKSNYNENIVKLVQDLTEKDKSWDSLEQKRASREDRKLEEMEKVSQFSPKVLALKLWDQISNIAETVNDLEPLSKENRKKYWKSFNAGYDKQIWKYSTLNDIIQNRIQACKEEQLFQNEDEEKNLQMFADCFQWLVNTLKSLMNF